MGNFIKFKNRMNHFIKFGLPMGSSPSNPATPGTPGTPSTPSTPSNPNNPNVPGGLFNVNPPVAPVASAPNAIFPPGPFARPYNPFIEMMINPNSAGFSRGWGGGGGRRFRFSPSDNVSASSFQVDRRFNSREE